MVSRAQSSSSAVAEPHAVASFLCLAGFLIHILFSAPLLSTIGFNYSDDFGAFYEKIHPGSYLILAAFFVFLCDRFNPLLQLLVSIRQYPAYMALLFVAVSMFLFCIVRSGPGGMAFILDTHITVPICAVIFSSAPSHVCRRAAYLFVIAATINSAVGITESIGQFRIFRFDPLWPVMREGEFGEFRASAFIGHPLNNAMFTAVALFVALALKYHGLLKAVSLATLLASLVAFGSRAALFSSLLALFIYGFLYVVTYIRRRRRRLSMLKIFLLISGVLVIPFLVVGGVSLLLNSSMGARLSAHSGWDDSADSRRLAFMVFDYMHTDDIVFGVGSAKVNEITDRLNQVVSLSNIENPWLLMFMYLGAVFFVVWVLATIIFLWSLARGKPLALKMAIAMYFITASTSNSFGRKDSIYLLMVSAVICTARTLSEKASKTTPVQAPAAVHGLHEYA